MSEDVEQAAPDDEPRAPDAPGSDEPRAEAVEQSADDAEAVEPSADEGEADEQAVPEADAVDPADVDADSGADEPPAVDADADDQGGAGAGADSGADEPPLADADADEPPRTDLDPDPDDPDPDAAEPGDDDGLPATEVQLHPAAQTHADGDPLSLERALSGIQVRVSAEIGRARLPLGVTLALPHGGVIELDRDADAPVDLYVNGTHFACGHLEVTEDGEWAMRLTSVQRGPARIGLARRREAA